MQRVVVAAVAALALLGAGCGSSEDEPSTAAKSGSLTAASAQDAKGSVTFCVAKDTTGAIAASIEQFAKSRPAVTVELLELPESADEARARLTQTLRAKSPECDVLGMDVVWPAEFAAQGWLRDLTEVVSTEKDQLIPSTVESARYQGKYWGLPYVSDAGFLYYRTDRLDGPPATWQEAYEAAGQQGGLVYQGARYEGLTVGYLELLFSAGGEVLTPDGKGAAIDSAPAREALELMVSGLRDGAVPRAVTTYQEEEARRAFENSKAGLMRNWPYAYALGKESKIKDEFAVAPLPSFAGRPAAGVLGGYDLGISAFSRNPEAALAFALYMTGEEAQRIAGQRSFPPTRIETYDDPEVRRVLPFAETLKQAVTQARSRPQSPVYAQISEAISTNVYDALQGRIAPDEAVTGMAEQIEDALSTF